MQTSSVKKLYVLFAHQCVYTNVCVCVCVRVCTWGSVAKVIEDEESQPHLEEACKVNRNTHIIILIFQP